MPHRSKGDRDRQREIKDLKKTANVSKIKIEEKKMMKNPSVYFESSPKIHLKQIPSTLSMSFC